MSATAGQLSRRKPRVGVIFTAESKTSCEGVNWAMFLGASLQTAGWSDVYLVPYVGTGQNAGATASSASSKTANGTSVEQAACGPITIVPYGSRKSKTTNPAECSYKTWADLKECNMVLFCVDPADSEGAAKALAKEVTKGSDFACVALQQGVKTFWALRSLLEDKGIVLVSGAVGISVARGPKDGVYRAVGRGRVVLERLKKENANAGNKFLNLLATADIPLLFERNITAWSWGAVIHNLCHISAALTGQNLGPHLRDWRCRLVWAAMMREALEAMGKTARSQGSEWTPLNPCGRLAFKWLERAVRLPSPLFLPISFLFGAALADLPSNMQVDLQAGRKTQLNDTIGEILASGARCRVATPVLARIKDALQDAVDKGDGLPSLTPAQLFDLAARPSWWRMQKGDLIQAGLIGAVVAFVVFVLVWCCTGYGPV